MSDLQIAFREKPDEEVLAASLRYPSLFELIVERYQTAFVRKATGIVRDRDAAHDIVQDTFLKIYKNAAKFQKREGASFKSWAYKILINTGITQYHKEKRRSGTEVHLDPEVYEAVARDDSRIEDQLGDRERVADALLKVPAHFARVLESYYLRDKSQKAIAADERVTVDTVKMRLFRARKLLKDVLQEYA